MTLQVHSSLSSIGFVIGGAPVVVESLLESLGENGTLVVPAATPQLDDPLRWEQPVPTHWHDKIREHVPVFDRERTPTALGLIPETFRNWPGTLRSNHPLESICARGRHAERITAHHSLAFSEGPDGPFGVLHELDSWILLLGVGFNRCTAMHFAETMSSRRRVQKVRFATETGGERSWVEVENVADDNGLHFPRIGATLEAAGTVRVGAIGAAESRLFRMRDLVEFACGYFDANLP